MRSPRSAWTIRALYRRRAAAGSDVAAAVTRHDTERACRSLRGRVHQRAHVVLKYGVEFFDSFSERLVVIFKRAPRRDRDDGPLALSVGRTRARHRCDVGLGVLLLVEGFESVVRSDVPERPLSRLQAVGQVILLILRVGPSLRQAYSSIALPQ